MEYEVFTCSGEIYGWTYLDRRAVPEEVPVEEIDKFLDDHLAVFRHDEAITKLLQGKEYSAHWESRGGRSFVRITPPKSWNPHLSTSTVGRR